MRILLCFFLAVCISFTSGNAQNVLIDTLFINPGFFQAVDGDSFPVLSVNTEPVFDQHNAVLRLNAGDSLRLTVINRDSSTHYFELPYFNTGAGVNASDTATLSAYFPAPGTYSYSDSAESGTYLGVHGMIRVTYPASDASFEWNIREFEKAFCDSLVNGKGVDFTVHNPDYFVLNGYAKPDIANDSTAMVRASVGDSVFIHVLNSGRSVHSIHFHGFHVSIQQSSHDGAESGRSKDTQVIYPGERLTMLLVPDKTGMYPVHDHNLIAVTGGGYFPNGIFLMMNIQ